MANVNLETRYLCYDDCRREGCPEHKLELKFNSVTNTYWFTKDDGDENRCFEQGELEAMIKLLKELSERRADSLKI